jgi:hypothetical protein
MIEERIPKDILYMKIKGNCPKARLRLRLEQQVRKDITKEGKIWDGI